MAAPAAEFPLHALHPTLLTPAPALPESARTVHARLARDGPLTHKDLVQRAGIPARTVRFALGKLKRAGLVEEAPSLRDARQSYWRLTRPAEPVRRPLRLGGW